MKKIQHHYSFCQLKKLITGYVFPKAMNVFLTRNMVLRFSVLLLTLAVAGRPLAQDATTDSVHRSLEVYGFAQLDFGYDTKQINPNWFDAMRVTKLPSYKD